MKRTSLFLVLMAFVLVTPIQAQRLGDGRFFRRMFGVEEPVPAQAYQRQGAEAAQGALKQEALLKQQAAEKRKAAYSQRLPPPTAAQQRLNGYGYSPSSKQTPTLARPGTRPPQSTGPSQTTSQIQSTRQLQSTRQPQTTQPTRFGYRPFDASPPQYGSKQPKPPQQFSKRTKRQAESQLKKQAKQLEKVAKVKRSGKVDGFGIDLRMKDKQAVVTRIDKSGTAAQAGIQQGDLIKTIGSLPIETIHDAEQFAEVLKPGDQLEFEIMRKGKESKMLVSFVRVAEENQAADPDALAAADNEELAEDDKPKADRDGFSFLKAPAKAIASRDTQSILSRPGSKTEIEELREVVELQKGIINGLQKRLNAIEQADDATPTLNFPQ